MAHATSGLGQTFVAPNSSNYLQSVYTGSLSGGTISAPYTFSLYAFAGNTLVGAPLFEESLNGPVSSGLTIDIGEQLTAGQQYVFLLLTSAGSVAADGDQHIADGNLISCTGTNCFAPLGSTTDVQGFALNFSDAPNSVPEPSTIVLLGSGVLGFAGTIRRKLLS
ncbi:MAG TPA: PEP-CTERM sorting domain-containing protein [Terriglobales bacterium]|nr:PEP-CTERM sorting domain-containing protein [Terriglobales bacterium]